MFHQISLCHLQYLHNFNLHQIFLNLHQFPYHFIGHKATLPPVSVSPPLITLQRDLEWRMLWVIPFVKWVDSLYVHNYQMSVQLKVTPLFPNHPESYITAMSIIHQN